MQKEVCMSKILISGCGITFPGERPTWLKILRLCKLDIVDRSGPAISNYLILNQLIEEVQQRAYTHVICQLTLMGKLDVELHEDNRFLMETDSVRNFEYRGYWPSSASTDHEYKKIWQKYLYSPTLERQDIALKLEHLALLCSSKNVALHVIQGYDTGFDDYNIYDDYLSSSTYKYHDFNDSNTVPCRQFQLEIATKINREFLHLDLPLEKFRG